MFIRLPFLLKARKLRFSKKLLFIILGLGLFFLSTIFISSRPLLSFYGFAKLVECSFLALYLSRVIQTKKQLEQIAVLFAIAILGESLLALMQYAQQRSLNGILYFLGERTFSGSTPGIANVSIAGDLILRPYATFPHPNVLAGYLLVGMIFVWTFLKRSHHKAIQVLAFSSLIFGSIALLLTFSRMAIFLWMLLIGFLMIKQLTRSNYKTKQKILITCFLIIVLGFAFTSPLVQELFIRFTQTSIYEESVMQRSSLQTAALAIWAEHPFSGVGLLQFIPALLHTTVSSGQLSYLQPVHNIFLLTAVETGIIGLVLVIGLLYKTIKHLGGLHKERRNAFLLCLGVICLSGMVDHYWLTLQQGQLLLTTIIGLIWTRFPRDQV